MASPTKEQCLRNAGRVLATARDLMMQTDPRKAAEDAHYAGGPSVEEIEARIRARRGESVGVAS